MTININGNTISFESKLVWDFLGCITKAIRPCCIYDLLDETINNLIFDRKYKIDVETDLSWINTDLSELVSVEVWL